MSMLSEPMAPWLRDFNRLFTTEGAIASFVPPADVIIRSGTANGSGTAAQSQTGGDRQAAADPQAAGQKQPATTSS
jgi:hypothetical protein